MPLTKVRRPKFERQDIKQRLFTPFLSCQRLNKIQRLLKLRKIDGILIIIGIDGRYNAGSLELFNYLFFDIFVTRKDDIERSKLDDDIFDDVMIFVKVDEVHVYCNGANYWLMLPYMASWQGLRLHCISEIEMEDPEKVEKFKIDTFADMTRSCNHIAVATKSRYESDDCDPFDPMILENWPIVQSYAFDDFGQYSQENTRKGFFTLVHKVCDISTDIHKILDELDPVYLENIFQKVLPQLEGLIENIFQLLDSKCFHEHFEIDEEIVEEPVVSYYKHLKTNKFSAFNNLKMYPFVVCGQNTRKSVLWDRMTNESNSVQGNREKIVTNPKHMVIECVSLHTGIVIARTVFLQGYSHFMKPNADLEKADSDVLKLSIAYNAILSTVDSMISDAKSSKDVSLNEKLAEEHLKNSLNKTRYSSCNFKIQKIGTANDGHGYLVIIRGVVFDIINEDSGENLGSVVYADTFVIAKTPINKEDNINAILRLGKRVPVFSCSTNTNLSNLHRIMRDIHQLDPICTEMVDIILPKRYFQEMTIQQMCCTFYDNRVLLFNKRIGGSILCPDSVDVFEGESYGDWTIISISCVTETSKNSNWLSIRNNEKIVFHLVFPNHGKLRKSIINLVIPKWKETIAINNKNHITCPFLDISWKFIQHWMTSNQQPVTDNSSQSIIDGISEDVHQSDLVKIYNSMNFSLVYRKSCIRVFSQIMVLSYSLRFYDHVNGLEDLSQFHHELFQSYYQSWHPHSIVNENKLVEIKNHIPIDSLDLSIVVTVLCGLPGSGQEFLVRKITKIIHDDVHWILLNPSSINEIRSLTENILKSFDKLTLSCETKTFRILLFSPDLCYPQEIIRTLSQIVSEIPIVIGSVCVCLNPESSYLDNNEYSLPGILEMCNEGWANTVILTGPDANSIKTTNLQRLLKTRNDLCTVFLTPKADVTKELDSILSKVSFQQKRFAMARVLYPLPEQQCNFGLENFMKISNGFYEITFHLIGHLLKESILRTIREIFKSHQPSPYERNIYFINGVITIEEDPKNLFSFTAVTATKQLTFYSIKNKENRGDNSKISGSQSKFLRVYFTSNKAIDTNNLDEVSELKMHFLSILSKFQRQVPVKRKMLSRSDLSQNQIDEIHNKRHLDSLPEGWFYNGITYVHMDGSRSDKHPALSDFIDSFIAEENLEIEKNSRKLDAITVKDAFMKE